MSAGRTSPAGARPVVHPLSNPATTLRVLELLADLDWRRARVADVGAGRGHFSAALSQHLEGLGLVPREHLFPCDLIPETFELEDLSCAPTSPDGRLPFEDDSLDAAVSIEVIEHVEDQFAFLRELTRVTRPGGRVIVTTPNVLSLNARVRNLTWGFPSLFDPLPLDDQDIRFLGGHIHPIAPYYLAYGALRAGLEDLELCTDRTKRSALAWSVVLAPVLWATRRAQRARIRRKRPELLRQNRTILQAVESYGLLTGRTAILSARKPAAGAQAS